MTKQENYIQFILEQLERGNVTYKDVYLVFKSTFKCTEPTFVRYWKIANERHLQRQHEAQRQKDAEYIEREKQRTRESYMSREKVVEMAENVFKLAYNKVMADNKHNEYNIGNVKCFTDSLEKLCRLQGYNKPDKIAQTTSEGKDIPLLEKLIMAANGVKLDTE